MHGYSRVLLWSWHERGEPLEELARLEEQMRGAVAPGALELELDPVAPKLEASFG